MDMAGSDDWLKRSIAEPRAAQSAEPIVTAELGDTDELIEAEAGLLDRFVGALIADLFDEC